MSSDRLTKNLFSFFHKELVSLDAVQHALLQCGNALTEDNIQSFLRHLVSQSLSDSSQSLLELVLSAKDEYTSSIAFAIITRLSVFLLFASPFDRKASELLNLYRHRVELAPKALGALAAATFPVELERTEDDQDDWGFKASQRQRKRAKRVAAKAATLFDPKLFKSLGLLVPKSPEEVDMVSKLLIDDHKAILKFYLDRLREPDIAATIQQGFIVQDVMLEPQATTRVESQSAPSDTAADDTEDIPSAYPMVQPMKAALYFDSAEGFGEWRILISTKADRDLREARRKQAKFFKIVIKKIKELSNGHLSDDNHKRLNGQDTEIPIYEAKMTRDTRLIYQVDCIPEYDVERRLGVQVERQVIKIFGIYTHAQIDKRLWDSMGRQLGRKGKEYRDRCTFRNRPHHAGDNVIMPAIFPPQEKTTNVTSIVPELPKEDLEEIHSLLVLEKFVTLSQALLNSIIADLDVAHVFNVTPQEKEIIEHPYSCYVIGRSGTGKTTTMLFKMLGIERAFKLKQGSMDKPRQIFVTQSRVLASKVEEYFSKLLDSLSTAGRSTQELVQLAKEQKSQSGEHGLIDPDDDIHWQADLPSKFSLLKDEHFPLFLTFDRLLTLLEADLAELSPQFTFRKGTALSPAYHAVEPVTPVRSSSRSAGKFVTYDVFLESYWPHFSQTFRKGLDPSLVFNELIGVIQGSEESLSYESRFLDQHGYENLSHRAQYTFANHRDIVYSIFQAYTKQKRLLGDFDAADRTHDILKAIDVIGLPGKRFDYLYVDEAQDNLLIDALLLRSLCRNPDGLFWAGDTAQTISIGSSFRFNDLKSFLFRLEFWPYAIDVLAREQGIVDGSKPVFFGGWDEDTVRYVNLPSVLGYRILVRDDGAREELKQQVGDIGLIMTLYESKGLEFDDVLLYKFFEDSTVDLSQWRVVLNLLGDESNLNIPAPCFEESRHAGVCSELKFLYVAITRARKNLWIADCSDKGEPMRLFWTARNQIQHCTPGMDVPLLAVSSTPEEWENSGRSLFQNKRYLQALHCFERAGLSREVAVSRTHYLRQQARLIPVDKSRKSQQNRISAFLAAAEAFLECATAAINSKEERTYYRNAGDCFERAEDDYRAARAYAEAHEFTTAAKLFRICAKFDEAVDIVKRFLHKIDADVAQNIFDVARLSTSEGANFTRQLFNSDEEELGYLEEYDLDVSRAAVLKELGRYKEAGEIHLAEGRTLEAIELFLIDDNDQDTVRHGHACILQGLWRHLSFAVKVEDEGAEAIQLLELASKVKLTSTDTVVNDEKIQLAMFRAIRSSDTSQLRDLGAKFASRKEVIQALLCFDHYFHTFPHIMVMDAPELSKILDDFLVYCSLLRSVAISPDPCNSPLMRKLFCIHSSTEKVWMLPTGTFLHKMIVESRAVIQIREDAILIHEWHLAHQFRECLFERLRKRVIAENEMCRRTGVFTPCLNFAINDVCNRPECPRSHISYTSFTHAWYNLQARIHFLQILIFHTLHAIPMDFLDRLKVFLISIRNSQRYWINRLHETLYPSISYLGTVASLDVALIPGYHRAIEVVKGWSRDFLFYSRHPKRPRLLTEVYQATNLCFYLDRANARRYIDRAPIFNLFHTIPDYFRHLEGNDSPGACVIHDLACSLQGTDNMFISVGILFVKQVVDKMLPIDVAALCDIIDYLCGSVILVRVKYSLHNVTLPRSWFINLLWRLKRETQGVETNSLHYLIGSIQQLLDRLQAGGGLSGYWLSPRDRPGHLSLEPSELPLIIRHISIARLYVQAREWHDLVLAVRQPSTQSPLDEMIQLYHESEKPGRYAPPTGVRRVFYKSIEEVPHLLSEASAPSFLSSLRADAPAFVPRQIRKVDDERAIEVPNSEDPSGGAEEHEDIEEPEVDHTDVMNSTTAIETVANTELPDTNELPSEEKIHATRVLQMAYRKVLNRRRKAKKTVAALSRTSFFEACFAEASRMDWPHGEYYRKLFLGPLPHVLVCLSGVYSYLVGAKHEVKERFKLAAHQELDDVTKKMTKLNGLLKDALRLQAALQPPSELHRQRNVEELKTLVREVEKLLDQLPSGSTLEVKKDLEIALKGIVMVKKLPKAKPKPNIPPVDWIDFEDGT
ncbi:hypothetical protein L208DRAFT_1381918 [Tricholoma matsutake]|nr:hypothetical protein L208DRAFT_1381918 [Tricholoma matsutake 945]